MHTPARKRESLLLKYMFLYNRDFATQDNKMWYDLSDSYSIEGGDVLVLSKDIVAIGLSERTTVSGAETFARNLLQNSDFKKVLAFDIPETRASCTSTRFSRWSTTTSSPSIPRSRAR